MTHTLVLLVRHAPHAIVDDRLCGRAPGVRLDEAGLAQAARLGDALASLRPAAVHASPLERTQETAVRIAAAARAPLITEPALNEIDFGDWTGARFEALGSDPLWRTWNRARAGARAPGGESMAEAQSRIWTFIQRLPSAHPGGTVVAVTHADMIKAALLGAFGATLDLHDRLQVDPGSVSRLVIGDWGSRILSINEAVNGWTYPRADQGPRRRARRLVPQPRPGRDPDRSGPLPAGLSQ